jgi:hypothetical protein
MVILLLMPVFAALVMTRYQQHILLTLVQTAMQQQSVLVVQILTSLKVSAVRYWTMALVSKQ